MSAPTDYTIFATSRPADHVTVHDLAVHLYAMADDAIGIGEANAAAAAAAANLILTLASPLTGLARRTSQHRVYVP